MTTILIYKIVFIPSPLSSYEMVSPNVAYRGYMSFPGFLDTAIVESRHRETCKAIQTVASNHNVPFVNTTKSLREAASKELIHGPLDWDHFNKRGYQILSADLAEVFLQPEEGIRLDDCVY